MRRLPSRPRCLPACSRSPAAAATTRSRRRRREAPRPPTPEDTGGEQATGCEQVAAPKPKDGDARRSRRSELDRSKTYVATIDTNCGEFEITLDAKRAPKTGGSFKYLADKGFFDGLGFHRIVPGFVIQGGDPKGNGSGGPGYSVVEAPPEDLAYTKGVVAMAKTGARGPPARRAASSSS